MNAPCHTVVPKGQKPPKITLTEVVSQVFPFKFLQIQKGSVSDHCLHYIIQNLSNRCRHKYDLQFHEFIKFYFWRVFYIWHYCAAPAQCRCTGKNKLEIKHCQRGCANESLWNFQFIFFKFQVFTKNFFVCSPKKEKLFIYRLKKRKKGF